MFSASRKISILLTLCLVLVLLLSSSAVAASYSNVYGLTLTRIRVRESASTSGTLFDNIEQGRVVYVTESQDSGGTTFLHVKYRTVEGKTETGWIAQSSGGSTYVEILASERAESDYGVSGGDLPKGAAGTKSASEREALRAQNTAAASSDTSSGNTSRQETTASTTPALNASSATISDVQMKLRALGIYAGDVTGRAGDKTIAAIKAFQKKIGIDQTGQLTKTTLAMLDEAYAELAASKSSSQGDEPVVEGVNSSVSSRTIEQVQIMLKALDYYAGDITGNAGEKTTAAIKAFQSQNGLGVDGIVGKATLAKLNEVYEAYQAGDMSVLASAATPKPDATATPEAASETIRQVQEKLKVLGYYKGEITGRNGEKTYAAIKAFQREYGLSADGAAGPITLAKLDEVYAEYAGTETSSGSNSASSSTVRQVQEKLKSLGFYTGEITGNAGSKTTSAIKAFQKKYGLKADGIVGTATLAKLDEVYAASKAAPNTATATPTAAPNSSVSAETIRQVQQKLKDLGLYKGDVTGNAGNKTTAAVKAFQEKYGLTADGVIGSATLAKLDEVYAASKTSPDTATPTPTASPNSSVSSATIKQVQQKLKDLGMYTGGVTGNAGDKTIAAVKAFQKKYGLTEDGVIGSATLAKLDEVYAASMPAPDTATPTPTAAPNSSVSTATIKDIQQKLKALGLYTGEVTGNAGSKTTAAIKAFQRKYGLKEDGIIGNATMQKLNEVYAEQSEKTTPTPAPAAETGASSSSIRQVQQKLKELGIYSGEVTGNAGSKTTAAVKTFQQKYGLTADGVIGNATLTKLDEVYNAQKTPEATAKAAASGNVSSSTVKQVQQKLKELGMYSGEVTGNAGSKTAAAVKAFQRKYGLTADGVIGSATLKKLDEVYEAANKKNETSATPAPKSSVSASTVKTVQKQLKELGFYSGEVTGSIGAKTTAAVKAFQRKYGLTADGILGNTTVSKINSVYKAANTTSSSSSSSSKKKIYSVDWFKAKNNKLFGQLGLTKGHSLRLTDLATGKSLNVTIQSAGNHLDVEPSTSADTEKFLSIYNVTNQKKITFLRRSGVVTTETGYRIVCSYYGQPHGTQLILTNHFNGQFCIHFLNSKTHGSGVVDGDHQACIRSAVAHYGSSNVKIIRTEDDL